MNRPVGAVVAAVVLLPSAALAGQIGGGEAYSVSPWRVIISLALCIVLAFGAILVLRKLHGSNRFGRPAGKDVRRIKVIEQQPLGSQRSLSLVEIDERPYAALLGPGVAAFVALEAGPVAQVGLDDPAQASP